MHLASMGPVAARKGAYSWKGNYAFVVNYAVPGESKAHLMKKS